MTALEIAPGTVETISANARAAGLASMVSVARHDMRQPLPLPDDSIDTSYSHMLFCMALTTGELEHLALELRRVLRPGGLVIYTARTHLGRPNVRLTDQSHGLGRVDAQQQAACAAGADGHLLVDQECQATEHALLAQAALPPDDLPDPVCELQVVCHGRPVSPARQHCSTVCSPHRKTFCVSARGIETSS